jgi:hypothetical protein
MSKSERSKTPQNPDRGLSSKDPVENGSFPSAPAGDFIARQIFVQNAARQLLARDEFAQQVLKIKAELDERLERDCRWKELYYGLPPSTNLPDPLNPEITEVDMVNVEKLKKMAFEASLSPEFVAAQVIHWAHARLGGGAAPNPLPGLLKQLRKHLTDRYASYSANRFAEFGEPEVYTLLTLYFSMIPDCVADARAALTVVALALAGSAGAGRRLRPDVRQHLGAQRERLLDWAIMFDIVEQDVLCETLLPDEWRRVLDLRRPDGLLAKLFGQRPHQKTVGSSGRRERARQGVAVLRATALAAADLNRCDQLLFAFVHARQAFDRLVQDCELLLSLGGGFGAERKDRVKHLRSSRTAPRGDGARRPKPAKGGK